MSITDTAIRCYGHLPNEASFMENMLVPLEAYESILMKIYSEHERKYQPLKKRWFELLPEKHPCRTILCVEMLEYILHMHLCMLSRQSNK